MVIFGEFYCNMLSVSRRTFTDIYSYIKYSTFYTSNQFALSIRRALKVKSSQHTITRFTLVVLNKIDGAHFLIELSLRERLKEIASCIFENARFDNSHTVNGSFYYFHYFLQSLYKQIQVPPVPGDRRCCGHQQ